MAEEKLQVRQNYFRQDPAGLFFGNSNESCQHSGNAQNRQSV